MNRLLLKKGDGSAEIEATTKFIRGLGLAELILGLLLMIAALLYGEYAVKHWFPADSLFWTSLSSPKILNALHLTWVIYLGAFFLFWHGALCRRLQRPLRHIGFAMGTLLSLKILGVIVVFGFIRFMLDSVNIAVNGGAVNLGDRFGIYVDLAICGVVVLGLLAVCLAWFCASETTGKALESSDQARYALDSVPLPVFLGFALFVCLAYGYLTDIVHPQLFLVGIQLPLMLQRMALLVFAAVCAAAAWGFYIRRPWGWFAGLLVGVVWAISGYYPPDHMSTFSGPDLDRYREILPQIEPAFRQYIVFDDILTFVALGLLIGYLVYVRRYLTEGGVAPGRSKRRKAEVPVYSDPWKLMAANKSWPFIVIVGLIQWFEHDYFIAVMLIGSTALGAVSIVMAGFLPRCVFRDDGVAFTGLSRLITPVFPYASFKSVQFITTPKPPKGIRSIEDGVLNLNVAMHSEEQRALLKKEFKKRDIAVTVLAPVDATGTAP